MNKKNNKRNLTSNLNEFNKYRNIEFVGDALLSFIVREYFLKADIDRNLSRVNVYEIVSNKHLSLVFDNLKLVLDTIFEHEPKKFKAKANQIEYMIYKLYEKEGMDKAREFVINEIIGFYYKQ